MRAGDLRHRVTIQKRTHAQDSCGEMDITWSDGDTIWADIRPLRGDEFYKAQQVSAKITHKIITRYRRDINNITRLKFGERYFNVLAVMDPGERRRELNLLCEEVLTSD